MAGSTEGAATAGKTVGAATAGKTVGAARAGEGGGEEGGRPEGDSPRLASRPRGTLVAERPPEGAPGAARAAPKATFAATRYARSID